MSKKKKTPQEVVIEAMMTVSLPEAESLLNAAKAILNQRKKKTIYEVPSETQPAS